MSSASPSPSPSHSSSSSSPLPLTFPFPSFLPSLSRVDSRYVSLRLSDFRDVLISGPKDSKSPSERPKILSLQTLKEQNDSEIQKRIRNENELKDKMEKELAMKRIREREERDKMLLNHSMAIISEQSDSSSLLPPNEFVEFKMGIPNMIQKEQYDKILFGKKHLEFKMIVDGGKQNVSVSLPSPPSVPFVRQISEEGLYVADDHSFSVSDKTLRKRYEREFKLPYYLQLENQNNQNQNSNISSPSPPLSFSDFDHDFSHIHHIFDFDTHELRMDNDILTHQPVRPSGFVPFQDPRVNTKFHVPNDLMTEHSANAELHGIRIFIDSVLFDDFPLFTFEDITWREIVQLVNEWRRRDVINIKKFYSQQIEILREQAKREGETLNLAMGNQVPLESQIDLAKKYSKILLLLREYRERRDQEEGEMKMIFKIIYNKWTQIRKYREEISKVIVEEQKMTQLKGNIYHQKQSGNPSDHSQGMVGKFRKMFGFQSQIPVVIGGNQHSAAFPSPSRSLPSHPPPHPDVFPTHYPPFPSTQNSNPYGPPPSDSFEETSPNFVSKGNFFNDTMSPKPLNETQNTNMDNYDYKDQNNNNNVLHHSSSFPSSEPYSQHANPHQSNSLPLSSPNSISIPMPIPIGISSSLSSLSLPSPSPSSLLSYCGVPGVLRVRPVPSSYNSDFHLWATDFLEDFDECKRLSELQIFIDSNGFPQQSDWAKMELSLGEIKQKIEQRMKKNRRAPGKAQHIPLVETVPITPTANCHQKEKHRREFLSSIKIYFELFVNGKLVRRSLPSTADFPSFSVSFDVLTDIKMFSPPSEISVDIYLIRKFPVGDLKLGTAKLPLPNVGNAPKMEFYSFSGSKMALRGTESEKKTEGFLVCEQEAFMGHEREKDTNRYLRGRIGAAVYCTTHHSTENEKEREREREVSQQFGILRANRSTQADSNIILSSSSSSPSSSFFSGDFPLSSLDPNDPRNVSVFESLRRLRQSANVFPLLSGNIFPFRPVEFQRELNFFQSVRRRVEGGMPNASRRRRVLLARHKKKFHHGVPIDESLLTHKLLKFISFDDLELEPNEYGDHDGDDEENTDGRYPSSSDSVSFPSDISSVSEVLNERPLPNVSFSFDFAWEFIENLRGAARSLRVSREPKLSISSPNSCFIILQVVNAKNLPVRNSAAATQGGYSAVRTVVQCDFQSSSISSKSSMGLFPQWNEIISLPFKPSNGSFSPTDLCQCNDILTLRLFDEFEISHSDDRLEKTTTKRVEHRWIGDIQIPFKTIYYNLSIEGNFTVNTPKIHLGYQKPNNKSPSLLHLYVTIDPHLTIPKNHNESFHSLGEFFTRCLLWSEEIRKIPHCSHRNLQCVVKDINGNPQLCTKFIRPLCPPNGYEKPSVFTRFVSQIPFVNDDVESGRVSDDVWCTAEEFFSLGEGDWEEHATLLCNYFLYCERVRPTGWKSFCLLGHSFPDGDCCFVIRLGIVDGIVKSEIIYNPKSGESWNLGDDNEREECPLQSIGMIFDADNVWANIQKSDSLSTTSFSLSDLTLWRPLFHSNFSPQFVLSKYHFSFQSLQNNPKYLFLPLEYYEAKAKQLTALLERKFEKKRKHLRTKWDYGVAKILSSLLESIEFQMQKIIEKDDIETQKLLQPIVDTYAEVIGFPLQENNDEEKIFHKFHDEDEEEENHILSMGKEEEEKEGTEIPKDSNSSTSEHPLVSLLLSCKLHEDEDPHATFALAVHCHPYPNGVSATWIYIAKLKEK